MEQNSTSVLITPNNGTNGSNTTNNFIDVSIEVLESIIPATKSTAVNTGSLWNISRGPYTRYITLTGLVLVSMTLCLLVCFYTKRKLRKIKNRKERRRRETSDKKTAEHVMYTAGEVLVEDNDAAPVGLSVPLIEDISLTC